jgi:hypothetical protein
MAALRVGSKCSYPTVYAALFHLSRRPVRHSPRGEGGSLDEGGPLRAPDGKLGIFNLP